jgi:hypothetical protein
MSEPHPVSLIVRAVYDAEQESVGVDAVGSEAFESAADLRAMVEILAAVSAKANCLAAQVIRDWNAPEDRKRALFDHFAGLKENMLNEMLERLGSEGSPADPDA